MVGTWYLLSIFPGHSGFPVCVCRNANLGIPLVSSKPAPYPHRLGTALPSTAAQPPAAAQTEEVRAACSSDPHYFTSLLELLHMEMFLHMWWSSMQRYLSKVGGIIPAVEANQWYEHGRPCRMGRGGKLYLVSVLFCLSWGTCDLWSFFYYTMSVLILRNKDKSM